MLRAFDLFVDAGTSVGSATQVRISYDLTGNGSWDRVETYRYFPTDPVVGYEHYTQNQQLLSSTGTLGAMTGGKIKVEVWSAIGNQPTHARRRQPVVGQAVGRLITGRARLRASAGSGHFRAEPVGARVRCVPGAWSEREAFPSPAQDTIPGRSARRTKLPQLRCAG